MILFQHGEPLRSTHASQIVFEPGQPGTQSPNLGVQVVPLLPGLFLPGRQLTEIRKCRFLSVMDLVWVHAILSSNLGTAFLFLQSFQHDRCLLAGGEPLSFLGHIFSPQTAPKCSPFSALNFLIHLSLRHLLYFERQNLERLYNVTFGTCLVS
jgi:hypothetical protein